MNYRSISMSALACAAILSAPAWAQEFEANDEPQETEGKQEVLEEIIENTSDLEGQPLGQDFVETTEALGDTPVTEIDDEEEEFQKPNDVLAKYLENKDIGLGWDEGKGRIIAASEIEFDVEDPEISDDFIVERSVRMEQLLIRAKAEVIKYIKSTMSAERMLEIPGNPLSKKFDPQLEAMSKNLRAAYVALKRADVELDFEIEQQKTYTPEQIAMFAATLSDKFKELGKVAANLDAKKKEALDAARKKVSNAQADVDKLQSQIEEELEKIKGSVSQSSSTFIELTSEMVILGGSVLKSAEGYDPEAGKYYIGVVYYWSRDLQRAAAAILTGTKVEFAKGKKSRTAWLAGKKKSGEYAFMLGPRSFIDDEGNMQILGFAAYPETDNTTKNTQRAGQANLQARAEVGYSLFADAYSHESSMVKARDRIIGANKSEFEMESQYTAKMGEAFKDITISGLGQVAMPASVKFYGLKARVIAMGVDATASNALKDIFRQSQLLGITVRKSQARQLGEDRALRKATSAAQNDAASMAEGAKAANKAVADHERAEAAKKAAVPKTSGKLPTAQPATKKTPQKGRLSGGTVIFDDDDE